MCRKPDAILDSSNTTCSGAEMALRVDVGIQQWLKLAVRYGVFLLEGWRARPRMIGALIPDMLRT
jgi:hypothetical protein